MTQSCANATRPSWARFSPGESTIEARRGALTKSSAGIRRPRHRLCQSAEQDFSRHPTARSRRKPNSLPAMAATTTNLASRTACRRHHAGIAEPAEHCRQVTTSAPRKLRNRLAAAPPGAHG